MVNAGSAGALGSTGTLSFSGGTLQYSAANQTDYSPRFSSAASQTYSVDTNGQNVTFATGLTGSDGNLIKFGPGTLTLSGANTYTGSTVVNAGTLAVTGSVAGANFYVWRDRWHHGGGERERHGQHHAEPVGGRGRGQRHLHAERQQHRAPQRLPGRGQ